MKRVIKLKLGINCLHLLQDNYFTCMDKNLQSIFITMEDEIDLLNYHLVIKYKLPDEIIISDTVKLQKELDVIIPDEVISSPGLIEIEFVFVNSNESLTVNKRLHILVKDVLEVNAKKEDIKINMNIAEMENRIIEKTVAGEKIVKKITQEQLDIINYNYKEIENNIKQLSEIKEKNLDTLADHMEEEIKKLSNIKKNEITSLSLEKIRIIKNIGTEEKNQLEEKKKQCLEEINTNKEKFKGPQGEKGDPGERGVQGIPGPKGDPGKDGKVDYSNVAIKDRMYNLNFTSIKNILEKNFYGTIGFSSGMPLEGLPKNTYWGNLFVANGGSDVSMLFYAPSNRTNQLFFKQSSPGWEDDNKKWVEIFTSDNLDLQNLQPITIESNVGNHIVLKRSGELKGALTSNLQGISLYNEKSKKMVELRDNGDVIIPANNLETENKDIILGINELKQEIAELRAEIKKMKGEKDV